jgi:hypothetical protein
MQKSYAVFFEGEAETTVDLIDIDGGDVVSLLEESVEAKWHPGMNDLRNYAKNQPVTTTNFLFESLCNEGYAISHKSIQHAVGKLGRDK